MSKISCETDHKIGLMQVFYRKDRSITSARIRHYIGTESGKSKFSYCTQSTAYAKSQLSLGQKPLIESSASKAIEIGETQIPDQTGQVKGQTESSSNSKNECGCSLAWFRTSACHVDDPGSNPGNRTIFTFKTILRWKPIFGLRSNYIINHPN
jgi:hypothetical protein